MLTKLLIALKRIGELLIRNQTRIALTGCAGLMVSLIAVVLGLKNDTTITPALFVFWFSLVLEIGGVVLVLCYPDGESTSGSRKTAHNA